MKQIDAGIELYHKSMNWLQQATIVQPTGLFQFTEGPVWHPDGFFLFSDTPANTIYRMYTDGNLDIYLAPSGLTDGNTRFLSDQVGSNGLAIADNKDLYICQHGNHGIALCTPDKTVTPLTSEFMGRPFNSPNDILLTKNKGFFFTDPPYGLSGQLLHPEMFQPVGGLYYCEAGNVVLAGTELQYPNGLFVSRNEQLLFVSSNHPDEKYILRYKINGSGCKYDGVFLEQNADGMTTDSHDNIYLATDTGINVVDATGKRLALLSLPETPSNLCWGGSQEEILFVTARSVVYFIIKPALTFDL